MQFVSSGYFVTMWTTHLVAELCEYDGKRHIRYRDVAEVWLLFFSDILCCTRPVYFNVLNTLRHRLHAEHYWQDLGTEHRLAVSGEFGKHTQFLTCRVPILAADIFVCVQWANLIGKAPKS